MSESALWDDRHCQICSHDQFVHDDVLWPDLVQAWQLDPEEVAYIDVQQGTRCTKCGANVRSQALARALIHVTGGHGPLEHWLQQAVARESRILEINEAGNLSPWLSRLLGHVIARYPECDMMRLPYPSGVFDLLVHSDTLEHVSDPALALAECYRVLAVGGSAVFTVPVIIGRLTRSRQGLPASYHGSKDCRESDFLVHTEFGADVWTAAFTAGFRSLQIIPFRYPSGLALIAQR
jgi:SAM-dependent methyltransferase